MSSVWKVKNGKGFYQGRHVSGAFGGELKKYHPNQNTRLNTKLREVTSNGKVKEYLKFEFVSGAPKQLVELFKKVEFVKKASRSGRETFVAIPKGAYIGKGNYIYHLRRAELHYIGEYRRGVKHWHEFVDILFWERVPDPEKQSNISATVASSFARTSWPWRD